MTLADFFQDETIFVAYGPERYYNDDFNLDENGKLSCFHSSQTDLRFILVFVTSICYGNACLFFI